MKKGNLPNVIITSKTTKASLFVCAFTRSKVLKSFHLSEWHPWSQTKTQHQHIKKTKKIHDPKWQTTINGLWSYFCSSQQKLKGQPAIVQFCFARHLRKHHKLFHTINYKYSGVLELGKSGGGVISWLVFRQSFRLVKKNLYITGRGAHFCGGFGNLCTELWLKINNMSIRCQDWRHFPAMVVCALVIPSSWSGYGEYVFTTFDYVFSSSYSNLSISWTLLNG